VLIVQYIVVMSYNFMGVYRLCFYLPNFYQISGAMRMTCRAFISIANLQFNNVVLLTQPGGMLSQVTCYLCCE